MDTQFGAVDKRIQNFAKMLEDRLHRKVDDNVALASQVNCVLFSFLS